MPYFLTLQCLIFLFVYIHVYQRGVFFCFVFLSSDVVRTAAGLTESCYVKKKDLTLMLLITTLSKQQEEKKKKTDSNQFTAAISAEFYA